MKRLSPFIMAPLKLVMVGALFLGAVAWACPTCGLNQSFTPKILVVSLAFVALPLVMVSLIAWRLWRDEQESRTPPNLEK